MATVHISPYGGQWYPAAAPELEALIEEKFASSLARTGESLPAGVGFVVPHAGPIYSGTVAAAVYRTLARQKPERIVLLAFPHRGGLRGVATPDTTAIATPFGVCAIEQPFTADFPLAIEERLCDHSFEIQLPFLQRSVPEAAIAPLYVGNLSAPEREHAADALARAWRPGTVFVASSDFTHYGRDFGHQPFPIDDHTQQHLREVDFEYIEAAGALDADAFLDSVAERHGTVCGTGPISLMLDVLRRIDGDGIYPTALDYQTSGEITGDWRHSVSYAALGFHHAAAFYLDEADGAALLESSAETLRRMRSEGGRPESPATGGPGLTARRGSFVSLHRGDELLGCIGNLAGHLPLSEEISQLTLHAALDDPRFRPAGENAGPIDIELSILTPFRRIRRENQFQIGRHGGYLQMDRRSGLLLPQVADGRGWTVAEFLAALERKSGLPKDTWRNPLARTYVFEAQRFERRHAVA